MAESAMVELVCKTEDQVVARIETEGALDAKMILRGITRVDPGRAPTVEKIRDGVQLLCGHCHEPLFFRAQDGELIAAMPGSAKVKP